MKYNDAFLQAVKTSRLFAAQFMTCIRMSSDYCESRDSSPSANMLYQRAVYTHFMLSYLCCRYSFLLSYLFAVYCQSGLDTAVHMSEETKTADRGAARNLIFSTWANSAYGFAFLMAILFSTQVSHTPLPNKTSYERQRQSARRFFCPACLRSR